MSIKKSAQGIPKVRYDGNINADYVPAIILQVSKITGAGYRIAGKINPTSLPAYRQGPMGLLYQWLPCKHKIVLRQVFEPLNTG